MKPSIRYLSGNAGTETPSQLLFFDAESHRETSPTDPDCHRLWLRLWCAISVRLENGLPTRRTLHSGRTADEFHSMVGGLASPDRPVWAFAHNLGFDLSQLCFWRALDDGAYTIGPVSGGVSSRTGKPLKPWTGRLCLEARPTFCVVRMEHGKVRFIDTGNYWPTRLYDIGRDHGIPKMPMPDWAEDDDAWFEYCENDCRVLEVAVINLLQQWRSEKCGVFKMTAPGLAFTHFRHTCHQRAGKRDSLPILLEDDSPSRPAEREAYYGGRIEPFFVGVVPEPVWHVDVNSLYPSVMRDNRYPVQRVDSVSQIGPRELLRKMSTYGAVARVRISSPDDTYTVRRDGVQFHCRGEFDTTLCGPELYRSLRRGHVAEVREAHLYRMMDLFSRWVDYWYGKKLKAKARGEAGAGELEFVNLILKSLSGKFGQLGDYWQDRPDVYPRGRWGHFLRSAEVDGGPVMWRGVAGKSQCKVPGAEPPDAFPVISAYITAYAREHMRTVISSLPARSALYMATDSLIVTRAGYDTMLADGRIDPLALGRFKVLAEESDCEIRGPNYYRIGDKWVRSGLWAKARHEKGRGWVADCWQQLPGIVGSKPDGSVMVRTVDLDESQVTPKGTILPDGWVVPFFLHPDGSFGGLTPKRREPGPASRRSV